MAPVPRPRVLLADDYAGVLAALRRLLAPTCDVVGWVEDGNALLDAALRLRPDVIVLDVALPQIDGLEACRRIKDAMPETKVVILTASDDVETRQEACSAGASAFVPKDSLGDQLLGAIDKAFLGDTS